MTLMTSYSPVVVSRISNQQHAVRILIDARYTLHVYEHAQLDVR
jgi:hypothetical protein